MVVFLPTEKDIYMTRHPNPAAVCSVVYSLIISQAKFLCHKKVCKKLDHANTKNHATHPSDPIPQPQTITPSFDGNTPTDAISNLTGWLWYETVGWQSQFFLMHFEMFYCLCVFALHSVVSVYRRRKSHPLQVSLSV